MFTEKFDKFACVGDSIQCDVGDVTYYAVLHYDPETRPQDFDCYTEQEVASWKADEWFFGLIEIVAQRKGWRKRHLAYMGGVDVNLGENNDYLTDLATDILPDAVAEVEETLMVEA